MTILIFFLVLFVLILVHEWGHFIAAKKTGMRVDEFGIGFPPKLFGIKKGETVYSFNALPIGGFVKIYGENAEDAANDAVNGADIARSFVAKSKLSQAIVLIAGVTMNIIFAWFLFFLVFSIGIPTAVDETTATDKAELTITSVLLGTPAARAGLAPGSVISAVSTEMDSLTSFTAEGFSSYTKSHGTEPISITYTYNGESNQVTITPEEGIIPESPEQPAVGVSVSLVETVREPILQAIGSASVMTFKSLQAITVGLFTLIGQSLQGTADYSQVAGPVGIVGLVGDAAEFGITSLLMFTAIISLNLAVINLLPFPALDGGRLVFVAIEAMTRRAINPIWVARVNTAGFLILMLLMIVVTYNDIIKVL